MGEIMFFKTIRIKYTPDQERQESAIIGIMVQNLQNGYLRWAETCDKPKLSEGYPRNSIKMLEDVFGSQQTEIKILENKWPDVEILKHTGISFMEGSVIEAQDSRVALKKLYEEFL